MDFVNKTKEQINASNDKFTSILNDYKKYYAMYNKNPKYQEYVNFFNSTNYNIQISNNDIDAITLSILQTLKIEKDKNKTIERKIRDA